MEEFAKEFCNSLIMYLIEMSNILGISYSMLNILLFVVLFPTLLAVSVALNLISSKNKIVTLLRRATAIISASLILALGLSYLLFVTTLMIEVRTASDIGGDYEKNYEKHLEDTYETHTNKDPNSGLVK